MDPGYRREYEAMEGSHWWFSARRRVLGALLDLHPPLPERRILDAGGGPAGQSGWLSRWGRVVSMDLEGPADVHGDLGSLPFRDGAFDWVCAFDVLEHLEDDASGLREMRRVCRPGGSLLLTVPALPLLWSRHDVLNRHKRRYMANGVEALAASCTCRVVHLTYFNTLLLPLGVVSRVAARRDGPSDLARSARLPGWAAKLLESVFASERLLLPRCSLPLGLSLFARLEPA